MKTNALYYGDNLDILRRYVPDDTVDLVYLDPPFNSNRDYNVIFKDESGRKSDAQLLAFEDTWHWGPDAERVYDYLTNTAKHAGRVSDNVSTIIAALRHGIGENQMMAYLVEMTARLVELRRVLKPTGSLYLHCDPTASHYLKVVLDAIFGPENFRSEIVWRRTNSHNKTTRQYGPIHDTILFYTKTSEFVFHPGYRPYSRGYIESRFTREDFRGRYQTNYLTGPGTRNGESGQEWRGFDPTTAGRHWAIPASLRPFLPNNGKGMGTIAQLEALLEQDLIVFPKKPGGQPMYKQYVGEGMPYQDLWAYQPNTQGVLYGSNQCIDEDVKWLENEPEKLDWDTQKPLGLLERIIQTSSDPGDLVLDPFCGCGTALLAAQKLERRWVGIDITYLSIAVMKSRLKTAFNLDDVEVVGQPTEVEGARQLASDHEGRYQFQWWALNLIDAQPVGGVQKKGADKGIDGRITFTGERGKLEQVLVSVKSGKVDASQIRDLKGTIEREKAAIGVFITLEEPSRNMREEAATAGLWHSSVWNRDYPRIQILTIRELLEQHRKPDLPSFVHAPYERAERIDTPLAAEQGSLFGGNG